MDDTRVREILRDVKILAQAYRRVTGKPLGTTGEIAEYEAAQILKLELTPARQAGYVAIERRNGTTRRLQIKGRCVQPNGKRSQRLGRTLDAPDTNQGSRQLLGVEQRKLAVNRR